MSSLVFVEFSCAHERSSHLFVGKDVGSIFKDTNDGKWFGFVQFSSFRYVDRGEVMKHFPLGDIAEGLLCIREGKCKSFYLGMVPSSLRKIEHSLKEV